MRWLGKLGAKALNAVGRGFKAVKAARPLKALKKLKASRAAKKGLKSPADPTLGRIAKKAYKAAGGNYTDPPMAVYKAIEERLPDGSLVRGPERQEYEDGTWETDEEAKLRLGKEKAKEKAWQDEIEDQQQQQKDREASDRRRLEAEQKVGFQRELRRIRDATPAERTRMDVERDLMDPDYEINHRRELELSEFDAKLLVGQREGRLDAMSKGGRAAGAKRRSRRKKAGAFVVASAGVFGALSQCNSNQAAPPVETVAQESVLVGDEVFEDDVPEGEAPVAPVDPAAAQPVGPVDPAAAQPVDPASTTPLAEAAAPDAPVAPVDPEDAQTPTTAATATTLPTSTTTPTTTTTATPTTAAPTVNPIAWAQGDTVLCNTGDLSAIRITHSFIMRDFVTGEDLLDHFDGAQATMSLSGGEGTTSQDTATVSGALATFDFVLSQPMRPSERLIPSLQIGGVSVPVSVNSIGYTTGTCTF